MKYPGAGEHGIHLMKAMLKFNPAERMTADEALEHPYFDDIKKKGYINTYRQNNQHFQSQDKETLNSALKAVPLNANLEKVGESAEHLRDNVSYIHHTLQLLLTLNLWIDRTRSIILS